MSHETKISKLLVGACLHSGNSLGEIARSLGISVTHDESQAILNMMELYGYIDHPEMLSKKACPTLTLKGEEEAKNLMSSNF